MPRRLRGKLTGRNPKMKASKLRLRGFTLIELAVVMAIIAIDLNIS